MHVDEARIVDLQHRFDEAELKDDRETLRELITDDFLSIGPRGAILTKAEWIDQHRYFEYHALDIEELDVRIYGPTAIVHGVQHSLAPTRDHELAKSARVSQVWVRQGDPDRWRLAAIQFSPLERVTTQPKLAAVRPR